MSGALRAGTSGWQYDHWRGPFYPLDLPKSGWFEHYCRAFDTVEINNTFYRLPRPRTFDAWREQAPRGFVYACKFSRYATHLKYLRDPEQPLSAFLERARRLEDHLGPLLVQLPPRWKRDLERLRGFLGQLPRDLRWALELRHPSWLCPQLFELLREHGVALVIHDMLEGHPREITADFAYLRFHGDRYAGHYSTAELSSWAEWVKGCLARGLDVYAYFNNDAGAAAVEDARRLVQRVFSTVG